MAVEFPDLPYAADALAPHVTARTLEYHHGKHHKGYVDKLNAAIPGTEYEGMTLESIIAHARQAGDVAVFNNAAQSWNHTFLWNSMSPGGGGEPSAALGGAIDARYGDLAGFRSAFKKAALGQFGSGWAWLVDTGDGLDIVATSNADTPLTDNVTPLLTLDVWEHAYYLDYQNQRDAYIDAFLSHLINWKFAEQNLETGRAAA